MVKAPANEVVRGALDLQRHISENEQAPLNAKGINCIRHFPQKGIRVWGARTLTSNPDYRCVAVRRLMNKLEESIVEGTRWVVFEPNDHSLWQGIRHDITAFLMGFWRNGAFVGSTPEEAFFVKCDEETHTVQDMEEGKVIILVGFAPLKPAEFIILKIIQQQVGPQ